MKDKTMTPCAYCQDGQPANCECEKETATPFIIDDYIRQLTEDRDKWRAMAEELAKFVEAIGTIECENFGFYTASRKAFEKFNQLKNQ